MVLSMLLITITLVILLAASYQDLKMREVANWMSFGLIFAALGIRTLFGWEALLTGLLGLAIFFLIAMFFYSTQQWGGGDSKLLIGLGAVIGFNIFQPNFSLALYITYVLIIGALFGLLWSLGVAIKGRKVFWPAFTNIIRSNRGWHGVSALGSVALLGGGLFVIPLLPLAIFPLFGFYLFTFMKSVEGSCFQKSIEPEKLVEGDWLAEDVVHRRKVVVPQGTLSKDAIWKLIQLKHKTKVETVLIKEGIPFVPSFFLAYVAFLLINNNLVTWVFTLL